MSKKQNPAAGAARTSKGTPEAIAESDAMAVAKADARKAASKARRAARREAYPVVVLTLKVHRSLRQGDVVDTMLTAANTWAGEHSLVTTLSDPSERKSGALAREVVIDTPESFAAKARVTGDPDKTRETAKAIATALRNDSVKAKAAEMGVAPKDLVLSALQSQFGLTIQL